MRARRAVVWAPRLRIVRSTGAHEGPPPRDPELTAARPCRIGRLVQARRHARAQRALQPREHAVDLGGCLVVDAALQGGIGGGGHRVARLAELREALAELIAPRL